MGTPTARLMLSAPTSTPATKVPAAITPSGFVAGVLVGADTMSRAVGVPTYIADVIVAASLIAVLVATVLTQYRVRWK